MAASSRWLVAVVFATSLAAPPATHRDARSAQDSSAGAITVQGFICPQGMTSDTLDPGRCSLAVLPGVTLSADEGLARALTLDDASYEQESAEYTWNGLPIPAEGPRVYEITLTDLLGRVTGFVAQGDRVETVGDRAVSTTLSQEEPAAHIAIYQLLSGPAAKWLTVVPLACPSADAERNACDSLEGVDIEVEIDGKAIAGSPFTSRYSTDLDVSSISFRAPTDATLTLTETGGFPSGFGPAPGFDPLVIAVADFERGPSGGGDAPGWYAYVVNIPVPSATAPADADSARPARIQAGACDDLTQEPRWDLTGLDAPPGSAEGSTSATVPAQSSTVVQVPLDGLLASPFAIVVTRDRQDPGDVLACGEIGGVRAADGSLAIGLHEAGGSGFAGVALLVPDPEVRTRTRVTIYLVPPRSEPAGIAGASSTGHDLPRGNVALLPVASAKELARVDGPVAGSGR